MKYLCACFLVLAGLLPAAPAAPTLKDARQAWLHGNYERAREKYQALAKQPQNRAAAVIGISKTWQSEGEYDQALTVVEEALKDIPRSADLLARHAELLYLRGRWDDAEKAAEKALAIRPDHFLARWVRGQVYRDRGDLKKADAEFRWFVRTYSSRSANDNDIKDPDELTLVALAGSENARWHGLSDQFEFILKTVYPDAEKAEKDFWWAEYYSGMLLLEKHNLPEALEAFGKAEEINASAAEVLTGRGQAALQQLNLTEADKLADRALKINPSLTDALRLKADLLLAGGDLKGALKQLDKARAVNPREESTLARVAACYFLGGKKDQFNKIVQEVEKHDRLPGPFYADLAENLEERRRYDVAEKYYQKAIDLRPMLVGPRANLGLLYMRMGREAEGKELLQKAFKADEYNIRVYNMLKVLKHLEGYATLKTKHFVIRYDAGHDNVLAHFMTDYLEDIYDHLSKDFHFRPQGSILIELFNKHEMFSGRVIAVPDLLTVGACTGKMFTMVSPRDKSKFIRRPFNWNRVLRHELVHVFNLEQTNFQVPTWYTEGLATSNEGFPRPPSWNRMLLRRFPDHLLNLDNINMAFARPGTEEWSLGYLQALLYVQYIRTLGEGKVGELLEAYKEGLDTTAAIERVCKMSKKEFEKGYRNYLLGVVKEIKGKAAENDRPYEELRKAHAKNPDDLDTAAQLAEKEYLRGDKKEARSLCQAVLEKKKDHLLATYVLARLQWDGGQEDEAIRLLRAAVDRNPPLPRVLGQLGSWYLEKENLADAARMLEDARKAEPNETRWLVALAKVYVQSKNNDAFRKNPKLVKEINEHLIGVLKDLAPLDADDLTTRKKLAELLLEAGRPAEAEEYARHALEIDVLDPEAQRLFLDALKKQPKKAQEIEKARKVFALQPAGK